MHCCKALGLVFVMIPVKRSLRSGKILLKIPFIGVNTVGKKRIVWITLHAFRGRVQ